MCGINGWIAAPGQRANGQTVAAMNRGLWHRGPDSGGVHEAGFCAIGMQRLAIVDLASGQQPMLAPDGGASLVYKALCGAGSVAGVSPANLSVSADGHSVGLTGGGSSHVSTFPATSFDSIPLGLGSFSTH